MQLRNHLPMSNPSCIHVEQECAHAHNSAFGTSRWCKTRSRTRVAGVWSQAPDPAADSFPGGGAFRTNSARSHTLDMVKMIGIDWNLTGRYGSVVHLPSDDLRQVLGGDRRRGGDTSRSSRTETISTTRPHSPNVSATRGNLEAMYGFGGNGETVEIS